MNARRQKHSLIMEHLSVSSVSTPLNTTVIIYLFISHQVLQFLNVLFDDDPVN
jgi:hypothetical protein